MPFDIEAYPVIYLLQNVPLFG